MATESESDCIYCPFCGKKIDKHSIFCDKCGKRIIDFNPWEVIAPSGNVYSYDTKSSATDTIESISAVFLGKNDRENSEVDIREFVDAGIQIDKLQLYEELGFIRKKKNGKYILTERGKELYNSNKEFEEEWNDYNEGG